MERVMVRNYYTATTCDLGSLLLGVGGNVYAASGQTLLA